MFVVITPGLMGVPICWGGRPPNGIEMCQNEVIADLN